MRYPHRLGTILLAVWLILLGLSGFVSIDNLAIILDVLAIGAGIALLLSR